MAFNIVFILRIVQAVFAVIVLGLAAYLSNITVDDGITFHAFDTNQGNFMIFNAVWTLLVVAYLTLAPIFVPRATHKFATLALDAVTMIFWFAGFIALAVIVNVWLIFVSLTPYHVAQAATAFGAFEWLLFVATTVLAALAVFRHDGNKTGPGGIDMQQNV